MHGLLQLGLCAVVQHRSTYHFVVTHWWSCMSPPARWHRSHQPFIALPPPHTQHGVSFSADVLIFCRTCRDASGSKTSHPVSRRDHAGQRATGTGSWTLAGLAHCVKTRRQGTRRPHGRSWHDDAPSARRARTRPRPVCRPSSRVRSSGAEQRRRAASCFRAISIVMDSAGHAGAEILHRRRAQVGR
jgi:hypothetical protein